MAAYPSVALSNERNARPDAAIVPPRFYANRRPMQVSSDACRRRLKCKDAVVLASMDFLDGSR